MLLLLAALLPVQRHDLSTPPPPPPPPQIRLGYSCVVRLTASKASPLSGMMPGRSSSAGVNATQTYDYFYPHTRAVTCRLTIYQFKMKRNPRKVSSSS